MKSKVSAILAFLSAILYSFFLYGCGQIFTSSQEKLDKIYEDYFQSDTYGLTVDNGVIYLNNQVFYGVGTNCYDLFLAALHNDFSKEIIDDTLSQLSASKVRMVRFNCGVYYPPELEYYFAHKTAYLDTLRYLFAKAQEYRIGLIPSFFWNCTTAPYYYGEEKRDWGNTASETFAFMQNYTLDVVSSIAQYKSLFAWEVGNEFMLGCNLPNSETPDTDLDCDDLRICYNRFAQIVRENDPHKRLIESGDGQIRSSQYNQWKHNTWKRDTLSQKNYLVEYVFGEMDGISEHLYLHEDTINDLNVSIKKAKALCAKNNKVYIVGEWGAYPTDKNAIAKFTALGDCLVVNKVQLSFVWNFNLVEGSIVDSFLYLPTWARRFSICFAVLTCSTLSIYLTKLTTEYKFVLTFAYSTLKYITDQNLLNNSKDHRTPMVFIVKLRLIFFWELHFCFPQAV